MVQGTGIGADVTENSKFNWTVNTDAFDAVLKGLNEVHGNDEGSDEGTKAKKEKKKARKEREAEEEDKVREAIPGSCSTLRCTGAL